MSFMHSLNATHLAGTRVPADEGKGCGEVLDDRSVCYFYTRSDNFGEIDRLPNDVLQSGMVADKKTSSRRRAQAADIRDNSGAQSPLCVSPTHGIWN